MFPVFPPMRRNPLFCSLGILFAACSLFSADAPPRRAPALAARFRSDGAAEIRWKKSGDLLFRTLGIVLIDARGTVCARPDEIPPRKFADSVSRASDTEWICLSLAELPGGAVRCSWAMRFLNAIPCAKFIVLDCELRADSCEAPPKSPGDNGNGGEVHRRLLSTPGGAAEIAVAPGALPEFTPEGQGKVRLRMIWRYDPACINTVGTAVTLAPSSAEEPLAQKSGEKRGALRE